MEQSSKFNIYSVNILRAKYTPERRQTLGIISIIIMLLGVPSLALIAREVELGRDNFELSFFFLSAFSVFVFFQIISKVICKTFVIGTCEITEQYIDVKTNDVHKTIAFNDIIRIKYKAQRRFVTGKTPPHNISHTVLFQIISKGNSTYNIHIERNVSKNGIKQKNRMWNADGNIFDILQRKKIIPVFERELDESNCLKH